MAFLGPQGPAPKDNRGPLLQEVQWIEFSIGTIVLGLRLCSRAKHLGKLFTDDYIMIAAWFCGLIANVFTGIAVNWGFGQHYLNLTLEQSTNALEYQFIAQPFANMALVLGRVSFAVSLITIIGISRLRRSILYTLIGGQFIINIIDIGLQIGECDPVAAYWNVTLLPIATCLNPYVLACVGYTQGAWNVFTDIVLALLPVFVIVQLSLKPKMRAGLVFLMGLGLFNAAAATVTLVMAAKTGAAVDYTYDYTIIDIWGITQIYLAITIASLPFCMPLFRSVKFFHLGFYRSWLGRLYGSGSRGKTPTPRKEWYPMKDGPQNEIKDLEAMKQSGELAPKLPAVRKDRFVTTTLMNAGKSVDGYVGLSGSSGSGGVRTHRASMEFKEPMTDSVLMRDDDDDV